MRCKWGDIITLEYGKPVKDKEQIGAKVPVYGTNGLIGTSNLPALCGFPSVIIGRKGAYRGVHYSKVPFSVIDTAFYVKPVCDNLDMKWVYYKFKTYDINGMDSGSAIPSTDRYELYAQDVIVPPLPEQRAIAATLSCLDDKIELNNRMNKALEEMAQAIFKSWFVDFEPFQNGEFVDSELSRIPKGWRVGTLPDLGAVVGGSTPSKANPDYYTQEGIAWITPKDLSLQKTKYIEHGETDITEDGLRNSSAKLMPNGTVLFSSRAPIGYLAIAAGEVCTNQGFKSIIPHANIGSPYVYFFLKSNLSMIEGRATGSTFKEVSSSIMKSVPALIPPDDILQRFTTICMPSFSKQLELERENIKLSQIRDALLPRLMNGEIRVPSNF